MDTLIKQIRRAQRRLALQRFLTALGWCWSGSLVLAIALIVAGKLRWLEVEPWIWGVVALAGGLLAAAGWAILTARTRIDAAIEIDSRFGLKERISSALAISPEELDSEAGRALVDDAVRRAHRIDIDERFRIEPPRQLLLPLLPGLIAVLLVLLVQPAALDNPAQAKTDPTAVKRGVKKVGKALAQKLERQRKRAREHGLKDAEQLFAKLEQQTKELEKPSGDRTKPLIKLHDLAKELEKHRQKLGSSEDMKKRLRQLKKFAQGPAERFAKAMGRGDFRQAMKELEKLQQDLDSGKLSDQQKEQLAKQLNAMKDELQKLADAHKAMQQDLQKQLDKARKAGNQAEADELEAALDKLRQQGPQMDRLKDLADKLGQCSQCMKNGQGKDAAARLQQVRDELKKFQDQLQEMEMVDQALDDLDKMRAQLNDQLNCPKCGGAGCGECQGAKPGQGLGRGRGRGARPEEKTDYATRDSHAPQKVGRGSATVVDMVDGPNIKGKVRQEIKEEFEAAERAESDPVTSQRLPRKHRQQVQQYFDRVRNPE